MKRVLNVGSGTQPLPTLFGECDEVRLDADESVKPDVVALMTDLGQIGEFDSVWCSHALEHLYPVDVLTALKEFRRVLKVGGAAIIVVPDLEGIEPTFDSLPELPGVSGHDLIYGLLDVQNPWMMHRTGFLARTLAGALEQAGFKAETKRLPHHNLLGIGVK